MSRTCRRFRLVWKSWSWSFLLYLLPHLTTKDSTRLSTSSHYPSILIHDAYLIQIYELTPLVAPSVGDSLRVPPGVLRQEDKENTRANSLPKYFSTVVLLPLPARPLRVRLLFALAHRVTSDAEHPQTPVQGIKRDEGIRCKEIIT